jgi:hypothetical protein
MATFDVLHVEKDDQVRRLGKHKLHCITITKLVEKLELILFHQEVVPVKKYNIAPQHRSSKNESIQTIIFIQPGLYRHPFSCQITSQFNLNCLAQY